MKASLTALPLGGLGEIGMNLMVYECDGDMIVVDAGITFPGEFEPGVEVVIPDITYLRHNIDRLKGIIITHAHEDHIGGLPYLWEDMPVPVYLSRFARLVLDDKLSQIGLKGRVPIHEVKPRERFKVGKFDLEFITITHSIPESHSVAIRTPHGTLLHTGDYKFDETPTIGSVSDVEGLKALGDEGVLAMLGDSTNIFRTDHSGSETEVMESLSAIINGCDARIFFCTFASNLSRLTAAVQLAKRHKRKAAFWGRSMSKMIGHARQCGYLPKDFDEVVVAAEDAMRLPRHKAMIFVTGSQGEARASLNKISWGEGPLKLEEGDTVLMSSKIIPGNERTIYNMMNRLLRRGAKLIHEKSDFVHVSGHGGQEEIKRMYDLVRPQIAVPVHGEYQHLMAQAAFAKKIGVPQQFVIENGQKMYFGPKEPHIMDEEVPVGRNYVDGLNILDEDRYILRERRQMATDGVVMVSVPVAAKGGKVLARPGVRTLGLIDEQLQADLVAAAREAAARALEDEFGNHVDDLDKGAEAVRVAVRRLFKTERAKRPPVVVNMVRI